MITLFTCPCPFEGRVGINQRNSIESWLRLSPRPDILLLGGEAGVADVAEELGLRSLPGPARTADGAVTMSDLFALGAEAANQDLLCFINTDIMLMQDFMHAVVRCSTRDRFLMIGQRWDAEIGHAWDFSPGWQTRLRSYVAARGKQHQPAGIDYFVHTRGLWPFIPPFLIGGQRWDNWLVWDAIENQKVDVINASDVVMAVHQNHHGRLVRARLTHNCALMPPVRPYTTENAPIRLEAITQ